MNFTCTCRLDFSFYKIGAGPGTAAGEIDITEQTMKAGALKIWGSEQDSCSLSHTRHLKSQWLDFEKFLIGNHFKIETVFEESRPRFYEVSVTCVQQGVNVNT